MRRPLFLAAAAALALGAAFLVARLVAPGPSDEARIRSALRDAAAALGEQRVGDAVELLSERFRGGGLDRREVKALLLREVLRGAWVEVRVVPKAVRVEGDAAEADLVAVALRGAATPGAELLAADGTALRIRCALERERGEWRIVAAEWERIGAGEVLETLAAEPDARRR